MGIYDAILIDTPLAPYFARCFANCDKDHHPGQELSDVGVEILKDRLIKEYLVDFYNFCTVEVGGTTADVMGELLAFEADKRAIEISLNSLHHPEITKDLRLA